MDNRIYSLIENCIALTGSISFSIYTRGAKDRMVLDGEAPPCYAMVQVKLSGVESIAQGMAVSRADVYEFLSIPLFADQHTYGIRFHDWVKLKDLFQEYETMTGRGIKGYLIERIKS